MEYGVVVIGGGHAGIEAAHASAKLGVRTAMVTMDLDAIGRMSCNPAIGGVAKGQLVRDIDALGGLMGKIADQCGIHFRMLNASKGPAVWGPRAQMDMEAYAEAMQNTLRAMPALQLLRGELASLNPLAYGGFQLKLLEGQSFLARAVVITSGTFLGAVMYTGLKSTPGGRVGEPAAAELAQNLKDLGLKTRRLKTGTPARLKADSIDYSRVEEQPGDEIPFPFSFQTRQPLRNSAVCWITHTSENTHAILREGFAESPMFTGVIQGIGPRYCPSIEDKVTRFADKLSHHLFLEPEGLHNGRIYVNGFSSSLPAEIQDRALRTVAGLENCQVIRYGYAVEYDSVDATQLHPTYMVRDLPGLFFAGQVNGTSGYEEAAGQGLLAGINAAQFVQQRASFFLDRAESYLGVMTDDLVRMPLDEPYRLFTSRSEYRLHIRQDNAEQRLLKKGFDLGLQDEGVWKQFEDRQIKLATFQRQLEERKVNPAEVETLLSNSGSAGLQESVAAMGLLKRPHINIRNLTEALGMEMTLNRQEEVFFEAETKYQGFVERQEREISRSIRLGHWQIPADFDFNQALALSKEARLKLAKHRPLTVAQAQSTAGVTPADISALIMYLQASLKDSGIQSTDFNQT
jgi:tRNA uridine 5-carboxymethylaminomethyl modification enzyme